MSDLTFETVDLAGDGIYHVLTGPKGAVTWTVKNNDARIALHSPTPLWDDHPGDTTCPFLDGTCHSDVRFPNRQAFPSQQTDEYRWDNGTEIGWDTDAIKAELTSKYEGSLRDNPFIPVDVAAALNGQVPHRLRDDECRKALADMRAGDTIHDAIRARYAARRLELIALTGQAQPLHQDKLHTLADHLPFDERVAHFVKLRDAVNADDWPGINSAADALTGVRG